MVHDWMLDVLTDLRDFAAKNELTVSERHIERALAAVSEELSSGQGIAQGTARIGHVREFSGSFAACRYTR